MDISKLILVPALSLALTSAALAQVAGGGNVVKWSQPPDLTPTGIDVNATYPNILADDFLCQGTGPITDIHIWGSWLNNLLPINSAGSPDPAAVSFKLSIHTDIPTSPAVGYSMPGTEIWTSIFAPGTFTVAPPAQTDEQFMDPPSTIVGADTAAYEYNFVPAQPFVQQRGTIYWLDVQALPNQIPGAAPATFGWKTSTDHWNDDAVYGSTDLTVPFPGSATNWVDLVYPASSQYAGKSIDLAFDLTTLPEPGMAVVLLPSALMLHRRRI